MVTIGIASENKNLVFSKLSYHLRCYPRAIVLLRIPALLCHYFLVRQCFSHRISIAHLLIVSTARGTLAAPGIAGSQLVMRELHDVFNRQQIGHFLHIVCRTHIRERPSFLLQLLNQFPKTLCIPFTGSILQAVSKYRDNSTGVNISFDERVQPCQRLSHGIVKGSAAIGHIVPEFFNIGYRLVVDHRTYSRTIGVCIKGYQGQGVHLCLCKLLLGIPNCSDGLVNT